MGLAISGCPCPRERGECSTPGGRATYPVSRVLSPSQGGNHSSGARVATRLKRPTRAPAGSSRRPLAGTDARLFGLAPGGVYHAVPVAGAAVRSYRTRSPLPQPPSVCAGGPCGGQAFCGTFPGVTPGGCYPPPPIRGARTFLEKRAFPAVARICGPRHLGTSSVPVKLPRPRSGLLGSCAMHHGRLGRRPFQDNQDDFPWRSRAPSRSSSPMPPAGISPAASPACWKTLAFVSWPASASA